MANTNKPSLRRSQAITTFGPGSIVDLRQGSFMMAGVDFWSDFNYEEIHEPNLERALHVREFRTPTLKAITGGKDLPAVIFPEWMVCPGCQRLAPWKYFAGSLHQIGKTIYCPDCRRQVYPARLIVACKHGHIDDFPWVEWAHRKNNKGHREVCARPELKLYALGQSSSLADLMVQCKGKRQDGSDCDAVASLSGATEESELKGWFACNGERPWLLDRERCGENVRPLQRGASNVYFSSIASSISIPPWSRGVFSAINKHWSVFKAMKSRENLRDTVDGMNLAVRLKMDVDDIVEAIVERQKQEAQTEEQLTEPEIRWKECQALRRKSSKKETDPASEFQTEPAEVPENLNGLVSKVMLVERLREVRALIGFTRIDPPDPSDRLTGTIYAPISKTNLTWRPALEVRGEGLYIELDEEMVAQWQVCNPKISYRAELLNNAYLNMCERKGWTPIRRITSRFLLIHSLAHCLIRQLALESGYSSASLRERLYAFEPDVINDRPGVAGLLIYTSTPDAEGSLGGLVRQGLPQYLVSTFRGALQEASWCSSDPLCIEGENTGPDGTNLAACHACLLLSETCCEEFNRFLDRAMLVGTLKDPSIGFFTDYLNLES